MIQSPKELLARLEKISSESLAGQSIDCVILGFEADQLKVLLLKWKQTEIWSLPGGYIHKEEDLDEAAHRILSDRTGLESIYLKQFHTFGRKDRQRAKGAGQLKKFEADNPKTFAWFKQRFITTGYFALVDIQKTSPKPDFLSEECTWKAIDELPELMLDHREIIEQALVQLRIQLNYLPISNSLLPEKFTMQNLQKLYEAILKCSLDRGNFQRKMLKLDIFVRLEKQLSGKAHRAPYLYRIDQEKYDALVKKGIGFVS